MIYGIMCYWEYEASIDKSRDAKWKLIESFPVDMDGYPLTTPVNVKVSAGTGQAHAWCYKSVHILHDPIPIMGRAVTLWTITDGVRLMAVNPPEWTPSLEGRFWDTLTERKDWEQILVNGYGMKVKTAKEVEKYFSQMAEDFKKAEEQRSK